MLPTAVTPPILTSPAIGSCIDACGLAFNQIAIPDTDILDRDIATIGNGIDAIIAGSGIRDIRDCDAGASIFAVKVNPVALLCW